MISSYCNRDGGGYELCDMGFCAVGSLECIFLSLSIHDVPRRKHFGSGESWCIITDELLPK